MDRSELSGCNKKKSVVSCHISPSKMAPANSDSILLAHQMVEVHISGF